MKSNVNLKAKIERHSRMLKGSGGLLSPFRRKYYKFNYNIVLFLVIFLFPFYPIISAYLYDEDFSEFNRADIDTNSIIEYYENDEKSNINVTEDSFLSVDTLIGGKRDLTGFNKVIKYTVQSGESLSSVAKKFGVSKDSILWANNYESGKVIRGGQVISIPPVSGLIHVVKKNENVDSIALKYKVAKKKILEQNSLSENDYIYIGQELIIPGAIKEIPVPVVVPKIDIQYNKNINTNNKQGNVSNVPENNVNTKTYYKIARNSRPNRFYWGNCTRYVAQYKTVNWRGNAKQWYANARAAGAKVGQNPVSGAIIVFSGRGYHPAYGHVGIVSQVNGNEIIIKDMNYRRLNEVTVRKISKNDQAILGYIYVD